LRAFLPALTFKSAHVSEDFLPAFSPWLCFFTVRTFSQSGDDAVRVTVTMNPDGSKTVYETNGANHRSVATTTAADGRRKEKIIYRLDAQGRYESGKVFSGSGGFRFNSLYRYNSAGQLAEETQTDKAGKILHKIVYSFDGEGHPTGYAIYDGDGNLLGRTTPKAPTARPTPTR
jgi:YD repeat-containing protein